MENTLHDIAGVYSQHPEILPLLVSALGLSAFQVKIHKWFSVQSDKVKQAITVILSVAAAGIPTLLGWLSTNPTALGAHATFVFTGMTLLYRFIVKPASANLASYKEYKVNLTKPQTIEAEANTFNV